MFARRCRRLAPSSTARSTGPRPATILPAQPLPFRPFERALCDARHEIVAIGLAAAVDHPVHRRGNLIGGIPGEVLRDGLGVQPAARLALPPGVPLRGLKQFVGKGYRRLHTSSSISWRRPLNSTTGSAWERAYLCRGGAASPATHLGGGVLTEQWRARSRAAVSRPELRRRTYASSRHNTAQRTRSTMVCRIPDGHSRTDGVARNYPELTDTRQSMLSVSGRESPPDAPLPRSR